MGHPGEEVCVCVCVCVSVNVCERRSHHQPKSKGWGLTKVFEERGELDDKEVGVVAFGLRGDTRADTRTHGAELCKLREQVAERKACEALCERRLDAVDIGEPDRAVA